MRRSEWVEVGVEDEVVEVEVEAEAEEKEVGEVMGSGNCGWSAVGLDGSLTTRGIWREASVVARVW